MNNKLGLKNSSFYFLYEFIVKNVKKVTKFVRNIAKYYKGRYCIGS